MLDPPGRRSGQLPLPFSLDGCRASSLRVLDRGELVGSRQVAWTSDPWSRGGYAYFDPGFDPALRAWLARPFGRLFFAGEHISIKWQGYMNGAIESGRIAAKEIAQPPRNW